MSEDKGFFKAGKGKFGKNQTPIKEDDIVLFKVPKNTSELINGGADGVNPYISAKDLAKGNGNSIVYGGIPTWISGYKFAVPDYGYIIRGNTFDTLAIEKTLDDADPTAGQDREDLIVGSFNTDGIGVIEIVKGATSNPAVKPTVNQETQIEITSIRVNGGTTQPATIENLVVYDENAEFTTSQVGGKADFNSLTLPFSGTKCINVVNFTTGDSLKFVNVGTFLPYDYTNFQLQIASTSGLWQNNGTIKIAFYNGATKVSDWVIIDSTSPNKAGNPYAFDSALATWQNIAVDLTSFNFTQNLADTIAIIKDDNRGTDSFKLDLIRLQKGVVLSKPPLTKTKLSEFINDGNGDITKPFITIDDIPIPKVVEGEYADMTALYAGQAGQTATFIQFVLDASLHSEVTSGSAYFEYLGTTLGTEADYRKLSSTEVAAVASSQADWNQTNTSSPDYIKNKLAGELRFPAYPSTRNDGVIPTNKILSTDASGNLKLFSIATAPAPYLDYVVPDSTLPSTTGNFQLHGSFFTPSMCLTANLATSIIFEGQTVNYAIFHSSNWIEVNITTGATEGSFAITLNNGLSATFTNAILISWGTILIPTSTDYTILAGSPDLTIDGEVHISVLNAAHNVEVKTTSYTIPISGDFRIMWQWKVSPLGIGKASGYSDSYQYVKLFRTSDNTPIYGIGINNDGVHYRISDYVTPDTAAYNSNFATEGQYIFEFRRIGSVFYGYRNGVAYNQFTYSETTEMKIVIGCYGWDLIKLKIITL